MPPRVARPMVQDGQTSFAGGLNLVSSASDMGPSDIRRSENFRLDFSGSLQKMGGTRKLSSALPLAPTGGGWWNPPGTFINQQVVVSNSSLYTGPFIAVGDGASIAWTNQGGTLSLTQRSSFAWFRDATTDRMYIADGGLLNKWDGAALTENIAGTPDVTFIWVYNRRLFGVNSNQTLPILYWSALDNGDTLGNAGAGGGSAVIRTFGNSMLICGAAVQGSNLLFHLEGVSVFTGWSQDDIAIQAGTNALDSSNGCNNSASMAVANNKAYFVSTNGIYEATPAGVRHISAKIDDELRALTNNFAASLNSWVKAVSHHERFHEVWFDTGNNKIFVYNYVTGSWSGTRSWPTDYSVGPTWEARVSNKPTLLAANGDGVVFEFDPFKSNSSSAQTLTKEWMESDNSGGTNLVSVAQFKRFFAGSSIDLKAWRWVYILADRRGGNSAALYMQTQTAASSVQLVGPSGSVWDEENDVWDPANSWGGLASSQYKVPAGGTGPFLDVTLTDDGNRISTYSEVNVIGYSLGLR